MNRIAALALASSIIALPGIASAAPTPTPTKAHPVVNLEVGPMREVANLHLTYLEQVAPTYAYAQYNTGAAQFILTCGKGVRTNCATRTAVVLEDGGRVHLARWVR